jgi:nitrogen fixation protein NifU and related proteins
MTTDQSRELILDHYENPHHNGTLDPADITHECVNPLCGDRVRVDMRLGAGAGPEQTVAQALFSGDGCIISQAAASMLMDEIQGKTVGEITAIEPQRVLDLVGIPLSAQRVKCALLVLQTVKDGIRSHNQKENI